MIFVSVGTHDQQFNRLIKAMDEYAQLTNEQTIIQYGRSNHKTRFAEGFDFADSSKIARLSGKARIIVIHAGAGSILSSLESGKPVIVVPRLKKYGEHNDNHQLELAEALSKSQKVKVVFEVSELAARLTNLQDTGLKVSHSKSRLTSYLNKIVNRFPQVN